jgi:hypothetical protein
VHHAQAVRGGQPVTDLQGQIQGDRGLVRVHAHPVAQGEAAEQLHDDEGGALELHQIGDVDDVAVANAVDRARLLEEARHRIPPARSVGTEQLERHLAAELDVLGAVHPAHAPVADELDQPIRPQDLANLLHGP